MKINPEDVTNSGNFATFVGQPEFSPTTRRFRTCSSFCQLSTRKQTQRHPTSTSRRPDSSSRFLFHLSAAQHGYRGRHRDARKPGAKDASLGPRQPKPALCTRRHGQVSQKRRLMLPWPWVASPLLSRAEQTRGSDASPKQRHPVLYLRPFPTTDPAAQVHLPRTGRHLLIRCAERISIVVICHRAAALPRRDHQAGLADAGPLPGHCHP